MPFLPTPIEGLYIFEPRIFPDARGYFLESYNERRFQEQGIDCRFVQDNEAASTYGVLRGMHFQRGASAQAKLLRVVSGSIFDVAVDLRPGSPTLHQWYGVTLSDVNRKQLFVPRGFAHGYLVTSERAVVAYKCDNFYDPSAEGGLRYDDPSIGIEWPQIDGEFVLSDRDTVWPLLEARAETGDQE